MPYCLLLSALLAAASSAATVSSRRKELTPAGALMFYTATLGLLQHVTVLWRLWVPLPIVPRGATAPLVTASISTVQSAKPTHPLEEVSTLRTLLQYLFPYVIRYDMTASHFRSLNLSLTVRLSTHQGSAQYLEQREVPQLVLPQCDGAGALLFPSPRRYRLFLRGEGACPRQAG